MLSMCSWHCKKAIREYLQRFNQIPFATAHTPLNYQDTDRDRGWDAAEFISSEWVDIKNRQKEDRFRKEVL